VQTERIHFVPLHLDGNLLLPHENLKPYFLGMHSLLLPRAERDDAFHAQ
jgi:hypothetical protein